MIISWIEIHKNKYRFCARESYVLPLNAGFVFELKIPSSF